MRFVFLLALTAGVATAPLAQSGWRTVDQGASWLNTFVDQPVGERTAFWFDGHWRRMGLGENPQQLLLRPGVQVELAPGLRAGAGYAYIATAPYGEVPIANPAREHRTWQQISYAHRPAGFSVTHRVRWEQRWLAPVVDGDVAAFAYQQRARYFVRAQRPIESLRVADRPLLGFVWDEGFLPIGHGDARFRRYQNRLGAGLALPVDARQRVEAGYMHQWLRIPFRNAYENNHTLVISWVWVGTR